MSFGLWDNFAVSRMALDIVDDSIYESSRLIDEMYKVPFYRPLKLIGIIRKIDRLQAAIDVQFDFYDKLVRKLDAHQA